MNNQYPKDDAQELLSKLIAELNIYKNQGVDSDVTQQLSKDIQVLDDYIRKIKT